MQWPDEIVYKELMLVQMQKNKLQGTVIINNGLGAGRYFHQYEGFLWPRNLASDNFKGPFTLKL